jgi:hypothetical protein
MSSEFRGVHALDGSDTIGEITFIGYPQRVLEHISPFTKILDKEVCGSISGGFVVHQSILQFGSGEYVDRLEAGTAHVFHEHIFHVSIAAQFDAHDNFIANLQQGIITNRINDFTCIGNTLEE